MKPVMQSRVGADGTCLAAAIASVLECAESDVGDLLGDTAQNGDWFGHAGAVLAETRGVGLAWLLNAPAGYSIGVGPSVRIPELSHAVVCLDGKIVHDPSPRGPDMVAPTGYLVVVPLAFTNNGKTEV